MRELMHKPRCLTRRGVACTFPYWLIRGPEPIYDNLPVGGTFSCEVLPPTTPLADWWCCATYLLLALTARATKQRRTTAGKSVSGPFVEVRLRLLVRFLSYGALPARPPFPLPFSLLFSSLPSIDLLLLFTDLFRPTEQHNHGRGFGASPGGGPWKARYCGRYGGYEADEQTARVECTVFWQRIPAMSNWLTL
jgi:hypothetical protein